MLRSLFEWLDAHPNTYWLILAGPTLALLGWIVFHLRNRADAGTARREWLFPVLLVLFLFAWRWPFLLSASEYNPDESQFIAGAMTLMHDPVFWRSVDGTTSGPLNFYALLPLHLLGLPLDYFTARLTGLFLVWLSLLLCHRLLRNIAPIGPAMLGVLPAAIFFAAATENNFIHYSSEHVAFLLMMAAACGLAWPLSKAGRSRWLAGAIAAGLLPWAKLQTLPLGGALVLWALTDVFRAPGPAAEKLRLGGRLLVAVAAPTGVITGAIALTGQWEHFYLSYLVQNLTYVSHSLPFSEVCAKLTATALETSHLGWWLAGVLPVLLGATSFHIIRRQLPGRLFVLGVILSLVAVFCILAPGRSSLHYLLLLVLPLTLCAGAAIVDLWPAIIASGGRKQGVIAAFLLAAMLVPLGWRLTQPVPEPVGQLADHWRRPRSALGNLLHDYATRGERLAVWGWLNSAYVESGLAQGTRDTLSAWAILPSPQRDYYRARYLADLERNRPALFLDAVGPGAPFLADRPTQAHETFPDLADYVRRHYRLVIDLQNARIYARNDVFAAHPPSTLRFQQLIAAGRPAEEVPMEPDLVSPANAPHASLKGRSVQMIEPPVELTWKLKGTERELQVQYGIHPKAYTEGKTNGAGFIVELLVPGQPPAAIFQRLLDPVRQPADRGVLTTRVVLPPFPPGTTLVVRATNGEFGDGGWDWVYVARMQFLYAPFLLPSQFPGFNRTPDTVNAAATLLVTDHNRLLMLPAPATLGYALDGTERRLNFAYGFQDGAWSNGGQTDGALYQVELQRPGERNHVVFARHLHPIAQSADRGRQHAEVILPTGLRAGDQLIVRILPGSSNAWDWTYIASLTLD